MISKIMRTICFFILVAIPVMLVSGCASTSKEYVGISQAVTISNIETFDELCLWSDTIAKARYIGVEPFDGYKNVYLFELEEDFTNNIDETTLHLYESSDTTFIEGKNYYLFMTGFRSSLYPHIIYTRVNPEFLLGEVDTAFNSSYTFYADRTLGAENIPNISDYIASEVIAEDKYDTAQAYKIERDFETSLSEADRILLITILGSNPVNPYVAVCPYRIDKILYQAPLREDAMVPSASVERATNAAIRDAGGLDVEKAYDGNTLAATNVQINSQWILLQEYNPDTGGYNVDSGQNFLFSIDSEEAEYILSLYPAE